MPVTKAWSGVEYPAGCFPRERRREPSRARFPVGSAVPHACWWSRPPRYSTPDAKNSH